MDKAVVLNFLQENSSFLMEQADKLGLQMKDAKKVVHFTEVQLIASEAKVRRLENEMNTLIENAKHNERLIENLFHLSVDLIKSDSEQSFLNAISQTLLNHFNLEAYALRLLPQLKQNNWLTESFFLSEQDPVLERIEKLTKPVCYHYLPEELLGWLRSDIPLQSFIQLPLCLNQPDKTDGIFIIGSANPKRFQTVHDTEYVQKMTASITACLNRLRGA